MPHNIQQVCAITPIQNTKGRIQSNGTPVQSQQAITNRMKRSRPRHPRGDAARRAGNDALDAPCHFLRRAARKRQQ
jgi:hypothetical protein